MPAESSNDIGATVAGVRLRRGLAVAVLPQGLVVEGGAKRHLLTGAAATTVLPRLLPLLDGEHPVAAIADRLGLTRAQVGQAVAVLASRGLIERTPAPDGTTMPAATALFLSRTGLAARSDAVVLLADLDRPVADPRRGGTWAADLAATVRDDLTASGVGSVLPAQEDVPAGTSLVVGVDTGSDAFADLARRCRDAQVPLLRVAMNVARVEIGPLFDGVRSACHDCFTTADFTTADFTTADFTTADFTTAGEEPGSPAVAASGPSAGPEPGAASAPVLRAAAPDLRATQWSAAPAAGNLPDDVPADLAAGLVVAEVLAVLGGPGSVTSWRGVTTVDTAELTGERIAVTPVSGCPRCGVPAASSSAARTARVYEWIAEPPPPGIVPIRRGDAGTAGLRDQALRKRHDDYPSSPRLDLAAEPVDLIGVVGNLLATVVGDTGRGIGGSAAGGTPAVDAYLLSEGRALAGRTVGVFKYDDLRHELIATRADCPPLAETLAGTGLAGLRADVVVVLVAAVGRLYGEQDLAAFRVAHLEAGAACGRLLAGARPLALRPVAAGSWDGRLAELLELRAEQEVVAAVIALDRIGGDDAAHE